MLQFIDSNVDAHILSRADDLTNFMFKSVTDLNEISVNMKY